MARGLAAAVQAAHKLKRLHSFIDVPESNAPAVLIEVTVTFTKMIENMVNFASSEQTGNRVHDNMLWDFVRKAAEQACTDVKALAAKLKYDIS